MTPRANGRVAAHVAALPPSGIRRFFDLVLGVPDVVSLGVGEPDFLTPWSVRENAILELERGRTSYTSNHGLMELRTELTAWLGRRYGLDYHPANEMLITVGASEAIDLALRAMLEPGDEVIVPEPCYVSYRPTVILAGGVPVAVETTQADGFRLDIARLEKAVTPRTRALLLNYPSNPTGATLHADDLERLALFAARHDIVVISDEIYAELTYEGRHKALATVPGMRERTVLVSGFSKSHAMTGWRLGYACGPADIIAAMVKIHQYTMLCAPTVSQFAAIEALQHCDDDVAAMRAEYDTRRRLIVSGFNDAGLCALMPEGAFYAFADIAATGMNSEQFCAELLAAEKVALVPGTAFGECGEGFIRACYAASIERIETALERVGRFVRRG